MYRVVADHPGWQVTTGGYRRVLADEAGGRFLIDATRRRTRIERLAGLGPDLEPAKVGILDPNVTDAPELVAALGSLGPVCRFANPSLWDALATAIVRQVVRADQAAMLYRGFCAAYGELVRFEGSDVALFPVPDVVLDLTDRQFTEMGMAFKRTPLRAAAEAYSGHGATWSQLAPAKVVEAVQDVPRIGPWTAGAAVADWSNDFSLYPYDDLAVRTWARRAAPSYPWPTDESAFRQTWRDLAGTRLSDLTLLTLAWGKHRGDRP